MLALAELADIPEGGALKVDACGRDIALFRIQDQVYAISAVCPHIGGPLDEGAVENFIVTCPWHGWTFDIRTGNPALGGQGRTTCYSITVQKGTVYLKNPEQYDDVSRLL